LRKARKDGYESDAGYLGDNAKRKGSLSTTFEFPSDGGYVSDATKKGADKKKKEKENRSQRQVVAKTLKTLLDSLVIHSTKERYCGKLTCFRMPAFTYDHGLPVNRSTPIRANCPPCAISNLKGGLPL